MFLQSTEAQELASRSADLLHLIDTWRLEVNRQLDPRHKVELGQFISTSRPFHAQSTSLIYQ
jgi:hypothetical protein